MTLLCYLSTQTHDGTFCPKRTWKYVRFPSFPPELSLLAEVVGGVVDVVVLFILTDSGRGVLSQQNLEVHAVSFLPARVVVADDGCCC